MDIVPSYIFEYVFRQMCVRSYVYFPSNFWNEGAQLHVVTWQLASINWRLFTLKKKKKKDFQMVSICVCCIECGCSCFWPIPKFCREVTGLCTKFYTNSATENYANAHFCSVSELNQLKKKNPQCRKCEMLAWRTCVGMYIWVFILLMSTCTVDSWINLSRWCLCFSLLHHTWIGSKKTMSQICINQVYVQSNFTSTLEDNQI